MSAVDPDRLKIWQALSEFFLDTEITETTFDHVARVLQETGYPAEKVHDILWGEVYPVLEANLRSVAGEWAGWSDAWLLAHLRVRDHSPVIQGKASIIREIRRCWEEVTQRLP